LDNADFGGVHGCHESCHSYSDSDLCPYFRSYSYSYSYSYSAPLQLPYMVTLYQYKVTLCNTIMPCTVRLRSLLVTMFLFNIS
jgi:hypothetical protein